MSWSTMTKAERRGAVARGAAEGASPSKLARQFGTAIGAITALAEREGIDFADSPARATEKVGGVAGACSALIMRREPDEDREAARMPPPGPAVTAASVLREAEKPKAPATKPKLPATPRIRQEALPRPRHDLDVPVSLGVTLLDIKGDQCRFPDGPHADPAITYCGHQAWVRPVRGEIRIGPWCEYHARLCYVPPSQRQAKPDAGDSVARQA
jgi:hypothetical protein